MEEVEEEKTSWELEETAENRSFFTQLTSTYLLGVKSADFLVGGVLGGGGALGEGVAAGAAVLDEAVGGRVETGTASGVEMVDFTGISFPVIGRMILEILSSADLNIEPALASD